MKKQIEYRTMPFEARAADGDRPKLRGLAAVFNSEAEIGGYFREVIRPGAFTKTLAERDVKMLWNHDTNYPLGSLKAGTLALHESARGLEVDGDPPTQGAYAGFLESIERGDVNQMSFGFEVIRENVVREEGALDLREVLEVKLYEVSPVTFPAYSDTEIAMRAAEVRDAWIREGKIPATAGTDKAEDETTCATPVPSADHLAEPDAKAEETETRAPDWVLNRLELDAAAEEII